MADNNRSKKLLVRTGLVTGATVATLMSVQNLALLDAERFATPTASVDTTTVTTSDTTVSQPVAQLSDTTIVHAAPEIVVLRPAGGTVTLAQLQNPGTASTSNTASSIQPPSPVENAASPVIVQQQVITTSAPAQQQNRPPVTRSSR